MELTLGFVMQYAQDFENVLLNPKDGMGRPIIWGNSAALEGYVRRLQEVAEQLKQKNRSCHSPSIDSTRKVATMFGLK